MATLTVSSQSPRDELASPHELLAVQENEYLYWNRVPRGCVADVERDWPQAISVGADGGRALRPAFVERAVMGNQVHQRTGHRGVVSAKSKSDREVGAPLRVGVGKL